MGLNSFGLNAENAGTPATFTYANISRHQSSPPSASFGQSSRKRSTPPTPTLPPLADGCSCGSANTQGGAPLSTGHPSTRRYHGQRAGRRRPLRTLRREVTKREVDAVSTAEDHRVHPEGPAQQLGRPGGQLRPDHVISRPSADWIGRSEGAHVTFDLVEAGTDVSTRRTHPVRHHVHQWVWRPDAKVPPAGRVGHRRPAARWTPPPGGPQGLRHRAAGCGPTADPAGAVRGQPVNGQHIQDLGLRLRKLRHRRDRGRARAGPARLGLSREELRPAESSARFVRRTTSWTTHGTSGPPAVDSHDDEILPEDGCRSPRRSPRSSPGWSSRATGAAPSRTPSCRASVHCPGEVPVPDDQVPVVLPEVARRRPDARASPLAAAEGLGQRRLPVVRRTGQRRQRHHGHLRRLVLVLPAVLSPHATTPRRWTPTPHGGRVPTSTSAAWSTRCAPAVRAFLHHGPERHGLVGVPRAPFSRPGSEPAPVINEGPSVEVRQGQRRWIGGGLELSAFGVDAVRLTLVFAGPPRTTSTGRV